MNKLNPSIKHHLLIGVLLSIWIFVFAFIIRPFDDGTINFREWVLVSIGFSLSAFLSYGILALIQNSVYKKVLKWNLGLEITSLTFFTLLYLLCVYFYYKSSIIKGGYTFVEFLTIIFLKATLITTPIIILARIYVIRLIPIKEDFITIRGENKLDVLKIKKCDLVCVSNSQNYVEIFFINNGEIKTKLIRSSLKKIDTEFKFLIRVHRSHLINPSHFISWKDQNTITLSQIEIPISKNYKENIISL
ncbi:MAG: LytTR family DNA-binding domain-containing protein [Cellulophaga sp.]